MGLRERCCLFVSIRPRRTRAEMDALLFRCLVRIHPSALCGGSVCSAECGVRAPMCSTARPLMRMLQSWQRPLLIPSLGMVGRDRVRPQALWLSQPYGSHSLRRDGATAAAAPAVRVHICLKRHGRWAGDAVYLYIQDPGESRVAVSREILGGPAV